MNDKTRMRDRTKVWGGALFLMVGLLASGCTQFISSPTAFAVYDFGSVDRLETPPAILPAAISVDAPTWLSSSAMQYRLEYLGTSGREAYVGSRWAGHPAEMLQRTLSAALTEGSGAAGRCRLGLHLDEFIQVFEDESRSATELVVRATLIAPRDEKVLERRTFVTRFDAPGADAQGGVFAHRQGVEAFTRQLAAWLDGLGSGGSGVVEECGR